MLVIQILFSAIIFGIWNLANSDKFYEVQYFEQKSGIYYERFNNIHIIREKWTMLITIDVGKLLMDPSEEQIEYESTFRDCFLEKYFSRDLCSRALQKPAIEYINNESVHLMAQLREVIDRTPVSERRNSRNIWLGIVGTVARKVFGILDQENDESYRQEINKLYRNATRIIHLVNNSTHILRTEIDSLVTQLKNNVEDINTLAKSIKDIAQSQNEHINIIDQELEYSIYATKVYRQTLHRNNLLKAAITGEELAGEELACFPDIPLESIPESNECGIDLFKAKVPNDMNACNIILLQQNTTQWVVLATENAWLFSTFQPEKLKISCEGELPDTIKLDGIGLLKFPPNCRAENHRITLLSLGEYNAGLSGLNPKKDLHNTTEFLKFDQSIKDNNLYNLWASPLRLSKSLMGNSLSFIQARVKELNFKSQKDKNSQILLYVSISLASVTIIAIATVAGLKLKSRLRMIKVKFIQEKTIEENVSSVQEIHQSTKTVISMLAEEANDNLINTPSVSMPSPSPRAVCLQAESGF
ncbi:uncharacterized protein LOC128668188 [Microplitis demolitor]|uniref:uncharacterized protein LOC128668188 n=1 Tax=Microplitis demolitor TaxID=69319 RepID=UPI00235B5BE6|nr:uncharacterized protein LOC128668188 [Microplitis demolitor]